MKITAISAQVKHPGRFSIFLDGSFAFGIDMATLLNEKLKIGQELSAQRLRELQSSAEVGKWYIKCLEKLYRRPHSIQEIRNYLHKKDKKDIAQTLIDQLIDRQKLDDYAFAKWFAEGRRRSKQRSTQMIRSELLSKGVSREIIDQTLPEFRANEQDALVQLIQKKRGVARYKDDKKLMQYLARQGFAYNDIKQALSQLESPTD